MVKRPVEVSAQPDAQDLYALVFQQSPVGIVLARLAPPSSNERPGTFAINPAFARFLGYSVEELVSESDQGRFTHPDDRATDMQHLRPLLDGAAEVAEWDKRYLHRDGRILWGHVTVCLVRTADGHPSFLISHIQDITERHALDVELLARAEHDALTGLFNRVTFEQHAQEQLDRCRRYGERAAVLMLDLDHLKPLNDNHGHEVGDRALVAVAHVLRRRLRATDVAARLGGDEFVVLLPHADHRQAELTGAILAEAVRRTRIPARAGNVPLSVSIGVAALTKRSQDVASVLARADAAMYRAKAQRDREPKTIDLTQTGAAR